MGLRIFLAILAALFVVTMWQFYLALRQDWAIAEIDRAGGIVKFQPPHAMSIEKLTGFQWRGFQIVQYVMFQPGSVPNIDATLVYINDLPGIEGLYSNGPIVTDAGLANLRHLSLRNTQATDAGIAELKRHLPNLSIMLVTEN